VDRLRRATPWLAGLSAVCGFALSLALLQLDATVVERFEGQRFAVPSKVLSAPSILYPGLDWQSSGLLSTLRRLGYREVSGKALLDVGSYRQSPGRLEIHLRAFRHPSRPEPARRIALRLRGSKIARIREADSGAELGAVLVEPERVGAYYGSERQQRDLIRLAEAPRHLVGAILAVEDRRFLSHPGIDLRRIGGALLANLRAGGIRQGGSTLTQQLVKNFFLTPERSWTRKLQEAAMALIVEARYPKPEILEAYLNEIYLGQRGATEVHGVGEASQLYFGKSVADLAPEESALLAAIIQSPNRISPHRHAAKATDRRNLVLDLMLEQGYLDADEHRRARRVPLRVVSVAPEENNARYFLDLLRRQLPQAYDAEALSLEGLEIHSTLEPKLQRAAARALREGLVAVEKRQGRVEGDAPLQGCIVVLRPQTGEVLALVGGRDYRASQFNRCVDARRPVGSVFKPFVYAAALEPQGARPLITLASFLDDSPIEIETPSGTWKPQNFDGKFRGRVSVREALERSLNAPTVRLGQAVGVARVAATARRLGLTSSLPLVPSLVLGTAELSPLEVARAYATLANGGVRSWPHTFEDIVAPGGGSVDRRERKFERVLDPGTSYLVISLLEGVVERGTASRIRRLGIRGPVAAKTGTSDDEKDLWFVGITPEMVAVVWVGYDEPASVGSASSRVALPIWAAFVKQAIGDEIRGKFQRPPEIKRLEIEPRSGALALAGCPVRRSEFFAVGTEPETVCPEGARRPGEKARGGLLQWLDGLF
jgi:penicillin-binding protein 1B